MKHQDDCIFCKIIKGEIPNYTVYEDDDFLAFLDIFPSHKGHTLIIPKKHYADILNLPEELASKVLIIGKRIVAAMEKSINADGYNFVQNNREQAGQEVMHYHMHIIPRYKSGAKGVKNAFNPAGEEYSPEKDELKEIAKLIKSAL